MGYEAGDRVLVNHQVATIQSYNEDTGLVVYVTNIGGATNTTTDHITKVNIQSLAGLDIEATEHRAPDATRDGVTNTKQDELPLGSEKKAGK